MERETDREIDRQTEGILEDSKPNLYRDKQPVIVLQARHTDREIERERDRQRDRQRDRHTERQTKGIL